MSDIQKPFDYSSIQPTTAPATEMLYEQVRDWARAHADEVTIKELYNHNLRGEFFISNESIMGIDAAKLDEIERLLKVEAFDRNLALFKEEVWAPRPGIKISWMPREEADV
jgi:hypothetical protein